MHKSWIALALLAGLSFAACGDGGGSSADDNGTPEKNIPSVVGTWKLDNAAVLAAVEKKLAGKPNPMGEMELELARIMNSELVVREDGTYEATMKMPNLLSGEEETETVKGTWTLEGDQFTIVTTEMNGVARENPDTRSATFRDGVIEIAGQGESPMDLIFRKK